MALTVTHATVATAADDPEAEINKAEWNAAHTVVGGVTAEDIALSPGTLTGSVTLPSGAWLLDVLLAVPESFDGGATLGVGDTVSGYPTTGILYDMDLTAGVPLGVAAYGVSLLSHAWHTVTASNASIQGQGYDGDGNANFRYFPAGGSVAAEVSASSPTVGAARVVVVYTVPA